MACIELPVHNRRVTLKLNQQRFRIGGSDRAHLQLLDPGLAAVEVELYFDEERWFVRSGAADVALQVNGRRVDSPWPLEDGDRILLGSRFAVFHDHEPRFAEESTRPLSRPTSPARAGWLEGPLPARRDAPTDRILLDHLPLLIGSGRDCDVIIESPFVSRRHLMLERNEAGELWFRDLASSNGTHLNGRAVSQGALRRGDLLALGKAVLRYQEPDGPHAPGECWEPVPMVGISPAMVSLRDTLQAYGAAVDPVLILGESGTGKELAARALHAVSGRPGPFVPVNCADISPSLIAGELFGHEPGAHSEAKERRTGLIRSAEGGTLLLDEIGELPASVQASLLRALQEKKVRPVGGDREIPVDVRFLFATNRNLSAEVREGRFRADLYYRIATLEVIVPPLRQRSEDIPLLARYFLDECGTDLVLGASAVEALTRQPWPGNVRQLRNVIRRSVVHFRGAAGGDCALEAEHLRLDSDEQLPSPDTTSGADSAPARTEAQPAHNLGAPLRDVQRDAVVNTLRLCGGNRSETARRLGISRSTLHLWLKREALDPDKNEQR